MSVVAAAEILGYTGSESQLVDRRLEVEGSLRLLTFFNVCTYCVNGARGSVFG
jgi:hypothetical protein